MPSANGSSDFAPLYEAYLATFSLEKMNPKISVKLVPLTVVFPDSRRGE